MAEALELGEEAFGGSLWAMRSASGFGGRRPVQLAGLEHVVERDQDRVLDRAATQSSLIPVSSSVLCSRLASWARSRTSVRRRRVSSRSSGAGTLKAASTNVAACPARLSE